MNNNQHKLVVVKLDDESSNLMNQYKVKKKDTKTKNEIPEPDFENKNKSSKINFDELSFALNKEPSLNKESSLNFSLLAASKEVPEKKVEQKKEKPKVRIEEKPTKTHSVPIQTYLKQPRIKEMKFRNKVKREPKIFENKAEDGYKIGFLPKFNDNFIKLHKNNLNLQNIQELLGIKASVVGKKQQ